MRKNRTLSLSGCGLKRKLRISFYLVLIIPILIFVYIISVHFVPVYKWDFNLLILILIGFFIGLFGFLLIHDLIKRLIHLSSEAKTIALGNLDKEIIFTEEDELSELVEAINSLQFKIRQDLQQLNDYSRKSAEYNLKLQRQSLLLSALLQINSLISSGEDVEQVLRVALGKLSQVMNSSRSYLLIKDKDSDRFYIRLIDGLKMPDSLSIKLELKEKINQIFQRTIKEHSILVIDNKSGLDKGSIQEFSECFQIRNALFLPMYSRNQFLGFLGTGNDQDKFVYNDEDKELMELFAKNISVIIETAELLNQLDKLQIRDSLTGLYNERFIRWRLNEEVKRGMLYHRPCGFLLFKIERFKELYEQFGIRFTEDILRKVASLLKDSVRDIDYVGRFGDYTFAVILVEKNKRQSLEALEYICKKVEFAFKEEEPSKRITLMGTVSENPLDGISAEELIKKAEENLKDT